jgi:hypothetical protein
MPQEFDGDPPNGAAEARRLGGRPLSGSHMLQGNRMAREPSRALFSKGEWLTLIGMVIVVLGSMLIWGPSRRFSPELMPDVALVRIKPILVTGFDMRIGWMKVGWAAVTCAIVCAAFLLLEPTAHSKAVLRSIHLACAIAILALVVLHIGPYPGIVVTAIGGVALAAAALVRYR